MAKEKDGLYDYQSATFLKAMEWLIGGGEVRLKPCFEGGWTAPIRVFDGNQVGLGDNGQSTLLSSALTTCLESQWEVMSRKYRLSELMDGEVGYCTSPSGNVSKIAVFGDVFVSLVCEPGESEWHECSELTRTELQDPVWSKLCPIAGLEDKE
jgi:hypothetical protein